MAVDKGNYLENNVELIIVIDLLMKTCPDCMISH